jgi:hypothetical protein
MEAIVVLLREPDLLHDPFTLLLGRGKEIFGCGRFLFLDLFFDGDDVAVLKPDQGSSPKQA